MIAAATVPQTQSITNVIRDIIKIYPNPAQDFLTLQLPGENIFDVTITDITGRQIFKETNTRSKSKINCTGFPNGVYFLEAANNGKIFTAKFTKQ